MDINAKLTRRRLLQLGAGSVAAGVVSCGVGEENKIPKKSQMNEKNSAKKAGAADLVIVGGTIVTMDESAPRAEALAAKEGRVQAVGSRAEIEALKGPGTKTLDLAGGAATPGLVDAHGHVAGLGQSLEQVDLRGAKSIDEVVSRINKSAPPTGWIQGRGWDQNLWAQKRMPSHEKLTAAFPDRPVWLRRVDGHAGWGNLALLKAAGIEEGTKSPSGGEILRDKSGKPTGVLVDAAMALVSPPEATREDITRWIKSADKHLIERGITGAYDMGISPGEDSIYRELAASGDPAVGLGIRVVAYASDTWFFGELKSRKPDVLDEKARYGLVGVKMYADGALGSRGAAMLEPYSDRPGHLGLATHSQDELNGMCAAVAAAGWQAATHAIGDSGNRAVLDAYEKALKEHKFDDHRFRVEHCQIMNVDDIPRFAKLGVIASMQPTHATSDMAWVEARIGKPRMAGAYPWRSFLKAGAHLCFGSDFPVEKPDITFGLHAAVTREDANGNPPGGWLPEQKLTLEEAIRAFSTEAAYSVRREGHLGRLKKGFQADITCFKENIFQIPPAKLRETPILATIIGGELVYRA